MPVEFPVQNGIGAHWVPSYPELPDEFGWSSTSGAS